MKIPRRLEPLLEQGLIAEVVRPLMSGKEAAVYVVHTGDRYCVAKVYKEAENRSFKHRSAYTEGRAVRNSRDRRAIERGSRYGREQEEIAWQSQEVDQLYKLAAAGVRVPKPILFSEGVLLMDIVLDPEGQPAPRMCDLDLSPGGARELHEWVVRQCVYMLCAGTIHGDLSEYNILMAWDGPVIIDLPQAIDAAQNRRARELFVRDVENVTNYLARFAPPLAESRFGQEIWGLYERAQLNPDTPLTGRWRGPVRKADPKGVLREIEVAKREHFRRG